MFRAKDFDNKKIKQTIESVYKREYNYEEFHYGKYLQLKRESKIAIIDDVDKINKEHFDNILSEFKDEYEKIIVFKSKDSEFNILDTIRKLYKFDEMFCKYKISELYSKKRRNLIKKIIVFKNPDLCDREINLIIKNINTLIQNQLNIISLTPDFLVLFVNTYLSTGYKQGGSNVFNAVFHSNIVNILKSHNDIDVNLTLYLLQLIAYHIHSTKEYPIKQSSILMIVDKYNRKVVNSRKAINASKFISNLIETKIFVYANSNYDISFLSNNYLSYFIAKEILRKFMIKVDFSEIESLSEKICFGINADILLFICYLVDNVSILNLILNKAEEFYKNIEEYDISSENIKYLTKQNISLHINAPTPKDKKQAIENIEQQEKNKQSKHTLVSDIYDYDESTINERANVIMRGFKYLEIISKILPDFIHYEDLDTPKFIDSIYKFPNKLIYIILKPFDTLMNLSDKELEQLVIEDNINEFIDINALKKQIKILSNNLILNVFNVISKLSAKEETIYAYEKYDFSKSINYSLINAMMYDELSQTEKMGKKLEEIDNTAKSVFVTNLIKLIIKHHVTFNSISYVGYSQHLLDKYLEGNKNMTLIRGKKRR